MELPTKLISADSVSPIHLLIYSNPKTGKSSLCAQLENSLHIDLERGLRFLESTKIDVIAEAEKAGVSQLKILKSIGDSIKAAGKPYEYIIIDTITKLENLAKERALTLYKNSPMGSTFTGNDVLTLPKGAGYYYLRLAFSEILEEIYTWADRIILIGHVRLKYIEKNKEEVEAIDIELTGKLRTLLGSDVDAIGLLERQGNQCYLNFKTSDEIICGCRSPHLANQRILVSEKMEDGTLKTYWDKIFID